MLSPSERQRLLEKYKLRQCTEDELALLDTWFDTLGKDEVNAFTGDDDRQRVREAIYSRLVNSIANARPKPVFTLMRAMWWRAAAVLLITGSLAVGLWYNQSRTSDPHGEITETFRKEKASPGHRKRLILPDGSVVTLNAGSLIRYPSVFSKASREVTLEGQAFFEVTADKQRPFTVRTGEVATRVLGTSFDVRAYTGEKRIDVIVRSGKVRVQTRKAHVDLLPSQKGSYDPESDQFSQTQLSGQAAQIGWLTGKLVFERASMKEIIQTLNRTYDVQIDLLNPALADCQLDARFDNESLDQIMRILCGYLEATYQKSGKRYQVLGGHCH